MTARIVRRLTVCSLAALVCAAAASPARATAHPARHLVRARAAGKRSCDGYARDHLLYHGSCDTGTGSPTAEGLAYYMNGWGIMPYLAQHLRSRGVPNSFGRPLRQLLASAAHMDDKKAPYDWAKDAPKSGLKSQAAKCLLLGAIAAGFAVIWSFMFDKNTQIQDAAKAGAAACAGGVGYSWAAKKLRQRYNLEI